MRPILLIWIKPRQTFELLAERDATENNKMIRILFFLTSMVAGFSSAKNFSELFGGNIYVGLFIALLFSGLLGLFLWNTIFSFIIWGVGKIFQGKATKDKIKLVIAYSLIPNLVHLIIGLILVILAVIMNNTGLINYQNPITLFVLWIFTFRILIIGLAFFNKYSYGYAVLTVLIPGAIIQGLVFGIKYFLG
jgi:hypothetical protein